MELRIAQTSTPEAARLASATVETLEILWGWGRELPTDPISPSQLRVMLAIEGTQGANQRTLVELLDSSPPSVSRLCDRLQAVGFVQRKTNPTRRREVELYLTERGSAFVRDLRARREKELSTILSAMSESDKAALTRGLAAFQAMAARAAGDSHEAESA